MTTAAMIVVASLLVIAVVGFIFGWNRGHHSVVRQVEEGKAWRERELEQLRTELEQRRTQDEQTDASRDQIEALRAQQGEGDASHERDRQLRADQLTHLRQQLDEATGRAQQLESNLDTARDELRLAAEELDKERASRMAAAAVYRDARQQQVEGLDDPPPHDAVLGGEFSVEAGEQDALREERIAELEAELGALRDVAVERTTLLESARNDAARLEEGYRAQIAEREQTIVESQAAREEADRQLDHEREIARGLREQIENLAERQHQSSQTRAAVDEAESARDAAMLVARDEIEELEQRYLSQIRDRASESARLRDQLEQTAADLQQLRDDHAGLTASSERLAAELENERTVRAGSERDDDRAQEIATALQTELQEHDRVVERLRQTTSELERSYTEQIAQREGRVDELEQRIATADENLDAALARATEQITEIDRLESIVQDRGRTSIEAADRAHELEARVMDLQTQLESAQLETVRQAEATEAANAELEKQLESKRAAVKDLQAKAQKHRAAHKSATAAVRESEKLAEQTLSAHELQVEQLTESVRRRDEALRGKIDAVNDLENKLEGKIAELEHVSTQEEQQRTARENIAAELRRAEESSERQLRAREVEVQHLSESLSGREQELEEHRERAATVQTEVAQLRSDAEAHTSSRDSLEARVAGLQAALTTAADESSRLQAMVNSARTDVSAAEEAYARHLRERELENERVSALLTSREAELPQAEGRLERALGDLETSERRLLQRQSRVEDLDAEVQRCHRVREKLLREVHDREQENRLLRQRIATEPAPADDLTVIHGIGPATAELLAAMGLISYRQIAALEERDAEWIEDRYPALRGRIRVEAWRDAAQAAHEEKFGEELE